MLIPTKAAFVTASALRRLHPVPVSPMLLPYLNNYHHISPSSPRLHHYPHHLVPRPDLHDPFAAGTLTSSSLQSSAVAAKDCLSTPPRLVSPLPLQLVLGCVIRFLTTALTLGINLLDERRVFVRHQFLQNAVSRLLFWPTLPWIAHQRWGRWASTIDETVVLGGAPVHSFGVGMPRRLQQAHRHSIRGVVNLCDEYAGPADQYRRCNVEQLRLPTINHLEPTPQQLLQAVQFIQRHASNKSRVYVHCRAGNGRSAAVVLAWLMTQHPDKSPQQLNAWLGQKRRVRTNLWQQQNIRDFQRLLMTRTAAYKQSSEQSTRLADLNIPIH